MAVTSLWAAVAAGFVLLAVVACGGSAPSSAVAPTETVVAAVPVTPEVVQVAAVATTEPTPASAEPKRKMVVLDPGHGGDEVGAAANGVVEKASNLDMAFRVEKLLLANGVDVTLTRRTDERASPQIPGFTATRSDIQARLDLANTVKGDVLVSIHGNGSTDTGQNGIEAWYDSSRGAFAAESKTLASLLVASSLRELRRAGFSATDRGLYDGACFRERMGRCFTLFVIAGPRETTRESIVRAGGDPAALGFGDRDVIYSRPANMPASLVELLILTNPNDAAMLRNEAARDAMARGVAQAILQFLELPYNG